MAVRFNRFSSPTNEFLTEQLGAVPLRLDSAAAVVAAPLAPDRPTEALDGAQGLVARTRAGAVLLPRPGVAAGRDDRVGAPHRDRVAAGATVIGAICGHRGDPLALRDLRQQAGQHRRIAHGAVGELDRANFQRRLVHGQMHLAPHAAPSPAMLARMPFALPADLDATRHRPRTDGGRWLAVHEQVQRPARAPAGQLDGQRLLSPTQRRVVRYWPVQACEPKQARHEARRLPKRQAEQDLHRQARLNGGIAIDRLRAALARRCRMPGCRRIEPDGQKPTLTRAAAS